MIYSPSQSHATSTVIPCDVPDCPAIECVKARQRHALHDESIDQQRANTPCDEDLVLPPTLRSFARENLKKCHGILDRLYGIINVLDGPELKTEPEHDPPDAPVVPRSLFHNLTELSALLEEIDVAVERLKSEVGCE